MTSATITVWGIPGPQGSKRHVGNGVMVESSKKVKPWREAVKWAVREAGSPKFAGPVCVLVIFSLPKPKSAPKRRVTMPDRKPDVDKLLRSTLDALTEMQVFEDDARVVDLRGLKEYAGDGYNDALDSPGARIWINEAESRVKRKPATARREG